MTPARGGGAPESGQVLGGHTLAITVSLPLSFIMKYFVADSVLPKESL